MLSHRRLQGIARLVLGAMLFMQAALAVAACDCLRVAPAQAFAAKTGEATCHQQPAGNANLCLAHCLGSDQKADTPQISVPVWAVALPLLVMVPDYPTAREAVLHRALPHVGAPPPRILFQSLLI